MPDSRQVATMGSASGALVTALFRARPRAVASVSFLWLFGLFAVFLAPAPVKITPEKLEAYKLKLNDVQSVVKALNAAERRLMDAQFAKDEFTVWFWRFRPEYKAEVDKRMPAVRAAQQRVKHLKKERDGVLREAKATLGLWSDAGLEESRQLLWSSFGQGKSFAKRQTMWDSLFALLDSRNRDGDWVFLLLRLLFTALINFTVGAVISVIGFLLSLPSLLSSFAPSWPSAIAFFGVAAVGACAMVASYLLLLYAAGTAVVVTTSMFLSTQRQRIGAGGGGGGRRIHYD